MRTRRAAAARAVAPARIGAVAETITIPGRFNGPPGSANGGYACGLVAALVGGEAEVTLRTPPPLDRELAVARTDGRVEVRDGDVLVAEAEAASVAVDVPAGVSFRAAEEASPGYAGFRAHAYETCFVCGPARKDGLGIFPGPVAGREVVAAPWVPPGPAGAVVPDEIVWAALDCPSGWAVDEFSRSGVLLGRLAARIVGPVVGGERYVVIGWPVGAEGRKRFAGSAVLGEDGSVRAFSRSTWLVPGAA
jgi:hypothetical protein